MLVELIKQLNLKQKCSTCGEEKDLAEYHMRRNRKGERERRKQCRSCVLKKKGLPGVYVRPN